MSRAIDAMVAEIMGWTSIRPPEESERDFDDRAVGIPPTSSGLLHRVPHYSTDPAACRELIDHHQTGYVEIHNGWGEVNGERVGGWHCRIVPPGPHEGVAREPTLEMAVCVACLRSEGVPEDQIEKARSK